MSAKPSTAGDDVEVKRRGAALWVTLNRPGKHNPLSRSVLARLRTVFSEAVGDEALRCAVITGAGDRYFAAGGDLRDLAEVRSEPDVRAMAEAAEAALDAVRTFPLPVIARVNGDAIGGGAELAVACDMRVVQERARIGYVHGRLAISPAWGGGTDLAALIGPARMLRMTTRGELVDAATARSWGLADLVAPSGQLDDALDAFIAPLLAQSARVLRACKAQALAARRGASFDARRAMEQASFIETWIHPDHWQALGRVFPEDD